MCPADSHTDRSPVLYCFILRSTLPVIDISGNSARHVKATTRKNAYPFCSWLTQFFRRVPQNIVRGSERSRGVINNHSEMPRKFPRIPRKKTGMQNRSSVSPSTCRGSIVFKREQLQQWYLSCNMNCSLSANNERLIALQTNTYICIIDNKKLKI